MASFDDIAKLIAAINPKYAANKAEVKKLLKEEGFEAAFKAAKSSPVEEHKIIYDSSSETLEPMYFYTLDLMNKLAGKTEKLVDNFSSSPGSGHFSELMGKATQMQAEVSRILGNVNTVIKGIINIIYDLKEFEIRLEHYEASKSKDKVKAESGLLSLKQIWMDNVDIKKGVGSINAMSQQLNFVTLRDAFMSANSLEEVSTLDLNERVRRILEARVHEFFEWKERSEKELRKRFQIERSYLKSQVNALKLYTRWARPYLKASSDLEQKDLGRDPGMVKTFNTIILQLSIIGKKEADFAQAIIDKKLPQSFKGTKLKRKYYSCVLVDFLFRGIPQRVGQHYAFGGRAEIVFRGFSLNEEELAMLSQKIDEGDVNEAMKLVSGVTDESLGQLHEDLKKYIEEEDKVEEKPEDTNPFSSLFSSGSREKEKNEKKKIEKIAPDSYVESLVRQITEDASEQSCFDLFDIYKKAHGMASHPDPYFFKFPRQ